MTYYQGAGLGEVLPVLTGPSSGATAMQVGQYDALASGKAVGGNFERFQDAAALGWVPNDMTGYERYLRYVALGVAHPAFKTLPEYVGWSTAGDMAYAVVTKQHRSNAMSPLWDAQSAALYGAQQVASIGPIQQWSAADVKTAADAFVANFTRLLTAFGYKGPVQTLTVPTLVPHPFFASLGQTVLIDAATIAFDGVNDDPTMLGERVVVITGPKGGTWRWGGVRKPQPSDAGTEALVVIVDDRDPRTFQYDERQWDMIPTIAWYVETRGGMKPDGTPAGLTMTPLTKWTGAYLADADAGPLGTLLRVSNVRNDMAMLLKLDQLSGFSSSPDKVKWGWGKNTRAVTGTQAAPFPLGPGNPNTPARSAGVPVMSAPDPWSNPNAPIPGAISTLPSAGALPAGPSPSLGRPLDTAVDFGAEGQKPITPPRNPADALPALGGGVLLLLGVGALMLLGRRKR